MSSHFLFVCHLIGSGSVPRMKLNYVRQRVSTTHYVCQSPITSQIWCNASRLRYVLGAVETFLKAVPAAGIFRGIAVLIYV